MSIYIITHRSQPAPNTRTLGGCAQSLCHFTHMLAMDNANPALDSHGNLKDAADILFYNSEGDDLPIPGPPASSEGGITAPSDDEDSADVELPAPQRKKRAPSIQPALQVAGKRVRKKTWKVSSNENVATTTIHPLFAKGSFSFFLLWNT
jgi:hypothetical protein